MFCQSQFNKVVKQLEKNLHFLNQEMQSVVDDDLKEEYNALIQETEEILKQAKG